MVINHCWPYSCIAEDVATQYECRNEFECSQFVSLEGGIDNKWRDSIIFQERIYLPTI